MPNYPEGVVFPEYRGKLFRRETVDGANILRTACYTAPRNRSKWSQLGNYLSFIPAAFHSALHAGKLDVVLVSSPPLFAVIPAICLAKLRGAIDVLALLPVAPRAGRWPHSEDAQANIAPKIANAATMNPRTIISPPVIILSLA